MPRAEYSGLASFSLHSSKNSRAVFGFNTLLIPNAVERMSNFNPIKQEIIDSVVAERGEEYQTSKQVQTTFDLGGEPKEEEEERRRKRGEGRSEGGKKGRRKGKGK